ncbi:MAG: hypothetical protein U0350_20125 [Caldilineaceae bacterium]
MLRLVTFFCLLVITLLCLLTTLLLKQPTATAQTVQTPAVQVAIPLTNIVQIAAGSDHTCAVTNSGGVKCWGWNKFGQLGNGNTADSNMPIDVNGLNSGMTAISAGGGGFYGGSHTCVLTSSSGVKCWGANGFGQLGNGNRTDSSIPVDVNGLSSGVTAISAGSYHVCALTSSGGVRCWGWNGSGQLGNNSTADSSTPVDVSGLGSGVKAIRAGDSHTCAVTSSGGVKCWGANDRGQLGNNSTVNSSTPVDVTGLSVGVITISTSWYHTCAMTNNGGVKCWGLNDSGQLGNGNRTDSSIPVDVNGLSSGVTAISTSWYHTCAVTNSGGVRCWGANGRGQLGNGNTIDSGLPVDVSGLSSGVTAISTRNDYTCIVTNSNGVKCWGANDYAQLGNGKRGNSGIPVDVSGLSSGVTAIHAGYHTCALTNNGGVMCWGWNFAGQLGNGSTADSSIPVNVSNLSSGVIAINARWDHSCAVTSNHAAQCWGWNRDGQLGNGSTANSSIPVTVSGLSSGVDAIAPGDYHTCALTNNGGVMCWGGNGDGQLGDGSTNQNSTPVNVSGLNSGVTAISAGGAHTCAVISSGVKCWGLNDKGQLGSGDRVNSSTPVDVNGLNSSITAIGTGRLHTCALTSSGGIKCWGWNGEGELGNGSTTQSNTPVDVRGLNSGMTAISVGFAHTCALTSSGGVKCWGKNYSGQLGNGDTGNSLIPVDVSGLSSGVTAISAAVDHTCALIGSGAVKCWGGNYWGQLGNGEAWSTTPVDVMEMTIATPTATPTVTAQPPSSTPTPSPTLDIATSTPTATPTEPTGAGGSPGFAYLPLVSRPVLVTPVPQPQWRRLGQPGLDASALAIGGNTLFVGERKNTRPGGLYQRSLDTCASAPDFTRVSTINNTSVLGLAFQGAQGVAATYDVSSFYSNNTGNQWVQTSSAFQHSSTVAIAGGSVFYIGTQDSGIYQSNDGGVNWQSLTTNPAPPKDINVLKLDTGTLWIGAQTGVSKLTLTGLIPIVGGLNDEASKQVWDLAFRAASDIYIATFNGVYHGDGANPWQNFGLPGVAVYSLALKDNFLYAGTQQNGVWRRDLNGSQWEPVTSPGWSATAKVRDLLYSSSSTCQGLLAATTDGVWIYQ